MEVESRLRKVDVAPSSVGQGEDLASAVKELRGYLSHETERTERPDKFYNKPLWAAFLSSLFTGVILFYMQYRTERHAAAVAATTSFIENSYTTIDMYNAYGVSKLQADKLNGPTPSEEYRAEVARADDRLSSFTGARNRVYAAADALRGYLGEKSKVQQAVDTVVRDLSFAKCDKKLKSDKIRLDSGSAMTADATIAEQLLVADILAK